MFAYSSGSHLSLIALGLFLTNIYAWSGSLYLIATHALASAGMFLMIGLTYKRFKTVQISELGGIATKAPLFTFFFAFFALSIAGLPGTGGFVAELLIIIGAFKTNFWIGFFTATTMLAAVVYIFWMLQRTLFGPDNNSVEFKDLNMIKVFSDLHGQESFMLKGEKSDYSCPRCGGGLYDTFYEDIPITLCQNCGGVLIKGVRLKRSLIREDPHPDIKKEKEAIKTRFLKLKKEKIKIGIEDFDSSPLLNCPVCGNPMARFFYSYNLPVVIDFCYKCDLYFLDKGELDLLQS